ncbi:pentatricopeptide repeat-containing protein [Tanacetum coccineum]
MAVTVSSDCFALGWPMRDDGHFFKSTRDMAQANHTSGNLEKSYFVEARSFWHTFRSFDLKARSGVYKKCEACTYVFERRAHIKDRVKIGVESDIYVATSLVTVYSKCKDHNGSCGQVLEELKEMLRGSSLNPNMIMFVSTLSACSELKSLKYGRELHGLLVKVCILLNVLVGTSLLDMYSTCGYWHLAYDVFKEFHGVRSLITWNSMISVMTLNGEHENAIGLFMMLESDGLKPDLATWKTMINELSQCHTPS